MTKTCPKTYEIYEDRLVKRWFCRCHGERAQGKRVTDELKYEMFVGGNDIREIYIKKGTIQALKALRFALASDLRTAKDKLDSWRGTSRTTRRASVDADICCTTCQPAATCKGDCGCHD